MPTEKKSNEAKNISVHPTAVVDDNVKIGDSTKIWHFSHIQSGAEIGESCSLGQNVNISNNVHIGDHVKIQNNVSVYEGVEIHDYVFCGPSCVFTNDLTPRSRYPKNHRYIPTVVHHDATIGANATIVCGNTIGHHATIAAGAVVTTDVPPHALYAGVPAKKIGWVCECGQVLKSSESRDNYFTCPDCGRSFFLYSGFLSLDRSKPVVRYQNGKKIVDNKIYYMETNALYSLINHLDEIKASGVNVATSVYALHEIVYGVKNDKQDYKRRRSILRKIETNNFILYPYTLKECVATAFDLDLNDMPKVAAERQSLWIRRKLIIESERYEDYAKKMMDLFSIDIKAEKEEEDLLEQENKRKISEQIEIDRKNWQERKEQEKIDKENDVEPQTVEIDWMGAFGLVDYEPDLDSEKAKLLMGLLDSLDITYTKEDIKEKLIEQHNGKNKNAFGSVLLGGTMYGVSKIINPKDTKLAGINDLADLLHLFYLRDSNHIIVSNDKIFEKVVPKGGSIKNDEFLKMCQNSKMSKIEEGGSENLFHRLFIIGNGFDSAHDYENKYFHFRDWMEERLKEVYPNLETDDEGHILLDDEPDIPFVTMDHQGEDIGDENQSLYMLMWLLLRQMKSDDDWNRFEEELYYLDIETVLNTNDWSIEDNARDKEGDINPFHADADYSEMASNIKTSVELLPKLFEKWIEDIEITIPHRNLIGTDSLLPIGRLMDEDSLYLSFNYTETLEKVYKVPGYLVDHIHGLRRRAEKYFDSSTAFPNTVGKIIVGHGIDKSRDFDAKYIGKESILQETIRELRKPVDKIIREHAEFWSWIFHGVVKEVYSFGFSYADVDLEYINQIIVSLQGGENVTWYLNKFDDRPDEDDPRRTVNQKFEEIIRGCGFKGRFERYES